MSDTRVKYAKILQNILNDGLSFSSVKNEIKEKGFINMLFMTTFRNLFFIKNEILPKFIRKKIPQKQNILEFVLYLGITEILFMNTPDYAAINSYVEASKKLTDKFGANFVNAVLRNIARNKEDLLKNRKLKYFSSNFIKILEQDYTSDEIKDMENFANIEPMLDLTLKNDTDYSLHSSATILPTGTVRYPANTIVNQIIGFEEGNWWVQDMSSAIAVKCLGNIDGKKVLDLCAAPGGKTAQLLDAGAIVTALDISEKRLSTLRENINRLKLEKNLTIICSDILDFSPCDKFDIVLLDAPCSATGTYRRHPELIHTKTINDVNKLATLQEKLLEKIPDFLSLNGLILYSTCSLAKKEGEEQIIKFIKKHQDFRIVPIKMESIKNSITKEGFVRILPSHYKEFLGADGFFISILQRKN